MGGFLLSDPKGANCLTLKLEKESEMKIEMRKIRSIKGFSAKGFCIDPRHWGMQSGLFMKAVREAEVLAKDCDDICIAIVHDETLGEFALADCGIEWDKKFILFNAEEANPQKGAVRVYTYDKNTRNPLINMWIKYKSESKI